MDTYEFYLEMRMSLTRNLDRPNVGISGFRRVVPGTVPVLNSPAMNVGETHYNLSTMD